MAAPNSMTVTVVAFSLELTIDKLALRSGWLILMCDGKKGGQYTGEEQALSLSRGRWLRFLGSLAATAERGKGYTVESARSLRPVSEALAGRRRNAFQESN